MSFKHIKFKNIFHRTHKNNKLTKKKKKRISEDEVYLARRRFQDKCGNKEPTQTQRLQP